MHEHVPVLLDEVLDGLNIADDGIYVDGTFGRGGHSAALLNRLGPHGRLIAVDRDSDAIEYGKKAFAKDARITLVKSEFSGLLDVVREHVPGGKVDGVMLDLGMSSPQLDNAQRGFSFMTEGPLDMRMDTRQKMTAAMWLATAQLKEMTAVIKRFGEERFAYRIARAIERQRDKAPLQTTTELAQLIEKVVPRKERRIHPATRTFQAIRIFINQELEQLQQVLAQSLEVLTPGGRLAVISFHSLEDRIVKRFMREHSRDDLMYSGLDYMPPDARASLRLVSKNIRASDAEIAANPRARSAVLRVAERLPA